MECPSHYYSHNQECLHYIWPLTPKYIVGLLLSLIMNTLAVTAGLGGGGIAIVIFIMFFDYMPKDATIVVMCSLFAATTANVSNVMTKSINHEPVLQLDYIFVVVPIMFAGSFIGILLNKLLPSSLVVLFIMLIIARTVQSTYTRFRASYARETEDNLHPDNREILTEQRTNPFSSIHNQTIFKNLAVVVLSMIALSMLRGSDKFPSFIGVLPCSLLFWFLYLFSFLLMLLFSYRHYQIMKKMHAPGAEELLTEEHENRIEANIGTLIRNSLGAGVFSGFGLGGGMFLIPMFRQLGCNPLQASASGTFAIFLTSFINCVQGVVIGVIQPSQFLFYLAFLGICGYFTSKALSGYLRKINRLSFAEGAFLFIVILALFNLPYSLYVKYENSGFDSSVLFGFGSLC